MPICPKCKNEYRDGFTVCADCKCDLVDSLEETSVQEEVSSEKYEKAMQEYIKVVKAVEKASSEEKTASDEMLKDKKVRPKDGYKSGIYRNSAERAEDNKSSAWTLLTVGVIGIVALILVMAGIIPVHLYGISKYMVYGVMFALFILFIVMGLVSLRNSKIFAKEAESESSLSDTMKEWCMTNIKPDELDAVLFGEEEDEPVEGEEISEEVKYFKRNEEIKRLISDKFMNLDEGFLEDFVDHIYEELFED